MRRGGNERIIIIMTPVIHFCRILRITAARPTGTLLSVNNKSRLSLLIVANEPGNKTNLNLNSTAKEEETQLSQ